MNALLPLWAAAVALLLAVLATLVWPLMRTDAPPSSQEHAPAKPPGKTRDALRPLTAGVISLALPIAALAIYRAVGDPRAAAELTAGGGITHATEGIDVETMVARLEARLSVSPDDLQGWRMLARSREVQERYTDAAVAYRRAIALSAAPDQVRLQAQLQADLADALGSAQQGDLGGPAQTAIDAALSLDADQPKALALAGVAAVRRGDLVAARRHWTRLLGVLEPGSDMARRVSEDIAQLNDRATMPPAGGPAAAASRP